MRSEEGVSERRDGSRYNYSLKLSCIRAPDGTPTGFLGAAEDITERRRQAAALAQSVREKEELIKETHHRVKNNLAMIVSLMRIGASRATETETKAVLKEMQTRVQSVVLLNEALYKAQNYTSVSLADYLSQTATQAFQVLNMRPHDLRLGLELDPVEALTAQAIPCGLIVNELITNSLKHAFAEKHTGEVKVSLKAGSRRRGAALRERYRRWPARGFRHATRQLPGPATRERPRPPDWRPARDWRRARWCVHGHVHGRRSDMSDLRCVSCFVIANDQTSGVE